MEDKLSVKLNNDSGKDGVKQKLIAAAVCVALAFVCITVCSSNSFLYDFNDWADVNWFLSVGRGILDGKVPYKDMFEQKGVLIYMLFALASLIDDGFLGVYLIEIIFSAAYLFVSYKILRLYKDFRFSMFALAAVAVVTYCSAAFVRGGGAVEEFCLPLLAYGLYSFLNYEKNGGRLSVGSAILCGLCAGCLFWIKYTMLALYIAFAVCIFVDKCLCRRVLQGFACVLIIVAGFAAASVPWIVYLGVNGALYDAWQVYIIDNIFSYAGSKTALQVANNIGNTVANIFKNFALYVLVLLGIVGYLSAAAAEKKFKIYFVVVFAFFFAVQCLMYGSHLYYHLALAAYCAFSMAWAGRGACVILAKIKSVYSKFSSRRAVKKGGRYGIVAYGKAFNYYQNKKDKICGRAAAVYNGAKAGYSALCAVALVVILLLCGNCTLELFNDESGYPQISVAEVIEEDADGEDYALLCYKISDHGFYTACGVSPDFYYFALNNFTREAFPELYEGQESYVERAQADYVVTSYEIWEEEKDGELKLYKELDEGVVYTQRHRESNFNVIYMEYVLLCVK